MKKHFFSAFLAVAGVGAILGGGYFWKTQLALKPPVLSVKQNVKQTLTKTLQTPKIVSDSLPQGKNLLKDLPSLTNLKNDPKILQEFKTDTDTDGLPDFLESFYGTDLKNPDTDGDGFSDGAEVKDGYNPLGPGKLGE